MIHREREHSMPCPIDLDQAKIASVPRRSLRSTILVALAALASLWPGVSQADPTTSEAGTSPIASGFGGKSSVPAQIAADKDRQAEPMFANSSKRYYEFKDRLNAQSGLSFGGDFNLLTQHASSSPGARNATGGVFRFYGNWTPVGHGTPDTGSLIFKLENRSKIGTISPQGLSAELGYAGLTAVTFSDAG